MNSPERPVRPMKFRVEMELSFIEARELAKDTELQLGLHPILPDKLRSAYAKLREALKTRGF